MKCSVAIDSTLEWTEIDTVQLYFCWGRVEPMLILNLLYASSKKDSSKAVEGSSSLRSQP